MLFRSNLFSLIGPDKKCFTSPICLNKNSYRRIFICFFSLFIFSTNINLAFSQNTVAEKKASNDPALKQGDRQDIRVLLQGTLDNHPLISSALKTLEASRSDSDGSFLSFFPSQSLTGDTGREFIDSQSKRDAGSDGSNLKRDKLTLSVTQPVFAGGAIKSTYDISKVNEQISETRVRLAEGTVLLDAITRYYELIKNYKTYNYALQKERIIKEILQLETARVERGSAIAVEELQAKGSLLAATQQRVSLNGQYLSSVSKFRNLFGVDPILKNLLLNEIKITDIVDNKEEAFKQALANNGNLIISDLNVDIAEMSKLSASAGFWPKLDLEGKVNWEKDNGGELGIRRDWSVLLKLSWNTQLSTLPALHSARHSLSARRSDVVSIRKDLERDIDANIISLDALQQTISLLSNGVVIAQEVYNAQKKQVEEGALTEVELLGAYVGVYDARSAYVGAKYDRNILKARMLNDLGVLSMDSIIPDVIKKK
jgi:outer membrane protein, adhesin transport system